ncbi:MAG TPA: hypothetical protein VFQ35_16510 [Polyangiaceae bacterium]|nr:hypothetical protein [Polyangiaceae bacterium]
MRSATCSVLFLVVGFGSVEAQAESSLESSLCGERRGCRIDKSLASLKMRDGGRHELVRLTLPEEGEPIENDANCTFEEFWLVARDAQGGVLESHLFAGGCSRDSPQEAWCGAPPRASVRVRGTVVEARWDAHALRCMSVYHSAGSYEASLESLLPLREESRYFRVVPPTEEIRRSWDFTTMRGSWGAYAGADTCAALRRGPIPRIPAPTIAPEFLEAAWQGADMSRCATTIDSVYGFAPTGHAAKVKLLLLGSREENLFVEVVPTRAQRKLPSDAILRVCYTDYAVDSYAYCHTQPKIECTRFGMDGRVLDGELRVERSSERARFKVHLPAEAQSFTVSYTEPSSGASLASSQQRPLNFTYMNDLFPIAEEVGSCELGDDGLRMRLGPQSRAPE